MIGLIEGQVRSLHAPVACVLTASGVGYDIELPLTAFCQLQLGGTAEIWTHLHVREDAQLLYGFESRQQREVFRQLIKINGVGAKMALAMLSNMSVAEITHTVNQDDESALVRIPGIGKKTAQRLLIELKDKLKHISIESGVLPSADQPQSIAHSQQDIEVEVSSALMSLGYKDKEASLAIEHARRLLCTDMTDTSPEVVDTQTLLRAALKQLSGF